MDTCDTENDADDSDSMDSDTESDHDDRPHRLHTKSIYKLMHREYVQNGRCTRFVPLLFPGMPENIIPKWMLDPQNKRYYSWPKEYKDLLWMLTKPENRVPEHIVPSSDRCQNEKEMEKVSSDTSEISVESE